MLHYIILFYLILYCCISLLYYNAQYCVISLAAPVYDRGLVALHYICPHSKKSNILVIEKDSNGELNFFRFISVAFHCGVWVTFVWGV